MTTKTVFLQIISHFIHPETQAPELSGLSPEEIRQLLRLGEVHSLYPVLFEGVYRAPGFKALPEQVQAACRNQARQKIIGQTLRTVNFLQVYRTILSRGLEPLVMKGVILRNLYPNPDARASSDEDLLVRREDYLALDEVLKELDFQREEVEHPLDAHEITYWHPKNGMHLEVHLTLFPEDSQAYGRLNREFEGVHEKKVPVDIQGTTVYTLCPTQHMLYLLCHGLKHFIHSGFGIRQVADMIVFAEACGDQIDWEDLTERTRREDMYLFWINLFDIGETYLGFSWEKAGLQKPQDVVPEPEAMLEDLLDSGIYGKSSQGRTHSANITVEAASSGGKKTGLRSSLFPDAAYMARAYPYVKKHRWLLPAAWLQRGVSYLRRSGGAGASEAVDTGKRRVALMKQYGIIGNKDQ